MSMALEFRAVSVCHADGTRALDEVRFTVPAGQFCVVLGPSGAGKSTLLRTVNGLTPVTGGEVLVGGERVEVRTLNRLRRRMGMIHQNFGLSARATVATNMMAGAAASMPLWRTLTGIYTDADKAAACALIREVGLEEAHLARRAEQLSGGQQQRVGIARAFMPRVGQPGTSAQGPAVVLADEPVASLDPRAAEDIVTLLHRQARERGTTVLCSLHQLDLARRFADRIVALSAGRVVFDGTPAQLHAAEVVAIYHHGQTAPNVPTPDALSLGAAA
ncbi:MAG: phosphonate ABC transporter ATP-binding protein [Sphingobium sp.]